ncbi:MAG TPA: membrane dipeptidase [Aliidongia sp.]|uniref:dipeptidase n=1 Tax=Aliidongia sp. TaxID=1914230 RepID=UPI002DDD3CD9|nr:membrane dipeptidase [Aliidongia sp.]HEV2675029.1 membrane dipeptidase [Aliidongia sp.]
MAMDLDWIDIATAAADWLDGQAVELVGFMAPAEPDDRHGYFLLLAEPMCCVGCWPADPLAAVEVFAIVPIPAEGRAVRLAGRWSLSGDPDGWHYQLRNARLVGVEPHREPLPLLSRRGLLAAGALIGLAACAPGSVVSASVPAPDEAAVRQALTLAAPADLHSHAGRVIIGRNGLDRPFLPVAAPMRAGGMALVSLAVVADTPTTHLDDRHIRPYRTPAPGELYAWSGRTFARAHRLIEEQGLALVTDRASLDRASADLPSVVIAAEGADFLEGVLDRVDEAYEKHALRHLQLTHYRVNELGDIQTEAPVHGGLTDFGADVVRRCNARGIVVDVAHGPYDLVKRAAAVTTKPLLLSHTSLAAAPAPRSRRITADHARLVADTGGVVGIWPPTTEFPDLASLAQGMARMVDVIGVDHVGLGSDMLGLLAPAAFADYDQLPDLARALLATGFHPDEASRILGGNYRRVFRATMA